METGQENGSVSILPKSPGLPRGTFQPWARGPANSLALRKSSFPCLFDHLLLTLAVFHLSRTIHALKKYEFSHKFEIWAQETEEMILDVPFIEDDGKCQQELMGKKYLSSHLSQKGEMLHGYRQTLKAPGGLAKLKHTALSAPDLTEDSVEELAPGVISKFSVL